MRRRRKIKPRASTHPHQQQQQQMGQGQGLKIHTSASNTPMVVLLVDTQQIVYNHNASTWTRSLQALAQYQD
jgi:hypothetical protein